MEDANEIKTERSMDQENKFDVKLPCGTEEFIDENDNSNNIEFDKQLKWGTNAFGRENNNTTNTNAHEKLHPQQADIPQMHNCTNNNTNNVNNACKREMFANIHNYNADGIVASGRAGEGARCGEIFVTTNAKRWTFVCTYCNKSTRDIGAFVLHIKKLHLSGICEDSATDDDDHEDDGLFLHEPDPIDERACNTSGHEQDVSNYKQMQQAMQYTTIYIQVLI